MVTEQVNFDADLDNFRRESDAAIKQTPPTVLERFGQTVKLDEWLTIKRYAERYHLTTQVVTNWLGRGVIPEDCTMTLPELNDIRLIKNQSYK